MAPPTCANDGFEGISAEFPRTLCMPTLHQNCRCFCLSRTHPHRSKQHAQTRISVGWATGRQHFKSDYAWSTSSLHTCLLSVSTLCDFRAAIWNNSPKKKQKLKDDPLPFSSESSLPLTLQSACPSVMFSFCFTCVFRFGRPGASPCRYCFEHIVVCGFGRLSSLTWLHMHRPLVYLGSWLPPIVELDALRSAHNVFHTREVGGNGRVSYFVGTQARTEYCVHRQFCDDERHVSRAIHF